MERILYTRYITIVLCIVVTGHDHIKFRFWARLPVCSIVCIVYLMFTFIVLFHPYILPSVLFLFILERFPYLDLCRRVLGR
jgi:multisubunit Na+/H+ antiporter MnhB subunit